MLATLEGAVYLERVAVNNPANVRKAKKAIKKAFDTQISKKGFSMVEVLSTCPTNWRMTAGQAHTWAKDNMVPAYPVGDTRVIDEMKPILSQR